MEHRKQGIVTELCCAAISSGWEGLSWHGKKRRLWERLCHGDAEWTGWVWFFFFFISGGFCHTLKWNSHGFTCVPIPIPPPTSLSTRSLWVFPGHQAWALVLCIQPRLVICFTLDDIHVSMLFSWNIPPSPSPTESKRLFYKSVFFFFFCSAYRVIINIFLNSIYMC